MSQTELKAVVRTAAPSGAPAHEGLWESRGCGTSIISCKDWANTRGAAVSRKPPLDEFVPQEFVDEKVALPSERRSSNAELEPLRAIFSGTGQQ